MSSDRKIQSARANGAKSRGPKTPEGRAKSARNAITHGLNSGTVVLQNESKERFLSLRQAYIDQLAPRNQIEADLVDQLVVARWRLERVWSLETSFLDLEMARQRSVVEEEFELIDEPTRTALAFKAACDGSSSLALLNRYEIRYQRTIHRTLEALRRLRESENENLPNEPKHHGGAAASGDENGLCAATAPGPYSTQTERPEVVLGMTVPPRGPS